MKALSLWQPWASLWLSPRKLHETRHWRLQVPDQGSWLAVHAAKRFEKDHPPELADILRAEFGSDWFKTLPTGAIIGAVRVIGCHRTQDISDEYQGLAGAEAGKAAEDMLCGNFDKGRYGFQRAHGYKVLKTPIPYRGMQGIFSVPDALLAEAMAS